MKLFRYKNLFFTLCVVLLFIVSCGPVNNQIANPSSDATIKRVYIQYNDSSPYASTAIFTINELDSTIYNADSLPCGTKLDSLRLRFSFASSLGYIMNDTVAESYNNYDAAITNKYYDLTKLVKIKNLATNGKTTRTYTMNVRVHKVETYLHVWSELNKEVIKSPAENQKAIMLNDKFYYFHNSGTRNTLFTSTDAATWTAESVPVALPVDVNLRNILVYNDSILLLHNGNEIYKSGNGTDWKKYSITGDPNYNYQTLLFSFKNKLWAVSQNKTDNTVKIASSKNGINWTFQEKRTFTNFPVSDFATVTFKPAYGREKVMIVGGTDAYGRILNTRWSAEDVMGVDSLYWVNLNNKSFTMDLVKNAGITYYGSKLLLIGGSTTTDDLMDGKKQLRQSIDQGLTWIATDSTKNLMPKEYKFRTNASIIHNKAKNELYIIGGKTATTPIADVWKIKVNFYSFKDYLENPTKY